MKAAKILGIDILARPLFVSFLLSATSLAAWGQAAKPQAAKPKPPQAIADSTSRTSADEAFELNIDERRFTRENFEASTSVGTNEESGLNLQIGVGLMAGRIDVLLRNVRGSVRFHGTLDRILEVLGNRRAASPAPSPR